MVYLAVLWDFDGTLAYTSADVWLSLEYAADQLGGHIDETFRQNDSNLAKPIYEIFQQVTPFPGIEKYQKFNELLQIHYRMMNQYETTDFFTGMKEMLEKLNENGVRNYIVTMKPKEALEKILEKKQWKNLFTDWISPDSFGQKEKTKAEMIAYIIKREAFLKDQVIYIGDTWSDVMAAHENQIECMAVTYGDGEPGKLKSANPEYIVNRPEELREWLERSIR